MKILKISEKLYHKLGLLAIPFLETSPNMVLERIVDHCLHCEDVFKNSDDKPVREPSNRDYRKLSHKYYRKPIIEVLQQLGGSGNVSKVMKLVYAKIKTELNDVDHSSTSTGIVRWENTLRFERRLMVKDGILKTDSPYGVWELNPDYDLSELLAEGG